jgi:hypothetical protein
MAAEEKIIEISDLELQELMNDDDLIDDFAFQYRMYLLQQQHQFEISNQSE